MMRCAHCALCDHLLFCIVSAAPEVVDDDDGGEEEEREQQQLKRICIIT